MQGTNRSGEGGAEPLGYVCDPGSELRLRKRETKVRANIINGMKTKKKKYSHQVLVWFFINQFFVPGTFLITASTRPLASLSSV